MTEVQIGLNGLLLGGVYALMALGLALAWGVMNIVNIAHGAFIVLGGYVTYWLFTLAGIDPFLSLPFSMGTLFIVGYLLQRYLINYIMRAELFFTLLITFGLDILIVNLVQLFWSADYRRVNPSYSTAHFTLGTITIPWVRLGVFAVALGITLLFFWVLQRSKLGRAIRATAQDLEGARLTGVKVAHVYALTYGISAAMAGAAGSLMAILLPINPSVGGPLTLKSFVIVVLGGLGNPWGSVVGGLIIGLVEEFGSFFIGDTFRNVLSFGILVLILIVRPQGILVRRSSA